MAYILACYNPGVDPVTHTLVGVGIGNALFRPKIGRGTAPIMVAASLLPDVDALVHLTGDPTAILMRRTFGHSLVMLPLWSLALALILRRFYPHVSLRSLFGMTFLGAVVHVFFDLVNSFGIVPLWPFSDWRPELAIIFIIDLIITGLLLIPLILCMPRVMRTYLVPLSRFTMVCVALYVLFCGMNRIFAQQVLAAESENIGVTSDFTYVFPEPLGPHRWRGVIREGNIYRIFLIGSLTGRLESKGEIKTWINDPRVKQARSTPLARRLEWFFKAPVWNVETNPESEPVKVTARDLRFRPEVIKRESPFVYRFNVYRDGRVERGMD